MEKLPQIPQDDVIDVMEMTDKIEKYILKVLKDHENNLAISSLISASINCLWTQCNSMEEVIFYRNMLVKVLDGSISHMQIIKGKEPKKPVY
jgi:hypothetical protein